MGYAAVSIDLLGTLVTSKPPHVVISESLARMGIVVGAREVERAIHSLRSVIREVMLARGMPADERYLRVNELVLRELGVGNAERLARHLLDTWMDVVNPTPNPCANRLLETLRQEGVRIAVSSNNLRREVLLVLRRTGLLDLVDAVVTPDVAGSFKPDRMFFEKVLEALSSMPGETLHVGDELREDYYGALAAGLAAVLYSPGGCPESLVCVTRLEEVAGIAVG